MSDKFGKKRSTLDVGAQYRLARRAERVLVKGYWIHPNAKHGTVGGSTHYGCQCRPCMDAHAAYQRNWRDSKRSKRSN